MNNLLIKLQPSTVFEQRVYDQHTNNSCYTEVHAADIMSPGSREPYLHQSLRVILLAVANLLVSPHACTQALSSMHTNVVYHNDVQQTSELTLAKA